MRFSPKPPPFYWGIDLHARRRYVCLVSPDGEIVLHRHMKAAPEPVLQASAPERDALVVAVACIFPWYGRAALGAAEGSAWVRGPALYMQALHGGKAKNDPRESHKMAVLLRGGLLPQAYGSPAARRATRDRVRRRTHVRRPRAELLAHGQHTTNQYTRPEMGTKSASKTTRDGVAARFADPAGPKTLAVAWAGSTYDEALLTDLELSIVPTAKHHDAHPCSRRRSLPGRGKILALGVLYARHARPRFPRGPDCVSSCRGVQCARDAAGQRWGTAGKKIGHAHLQGAFSEAAALPILAHTRARAVYYMLTRATGCEMDQFVHESRAQSGGAGRRTGQRRDAPASGTLKA